MKKVIITLVLFCVKFNLSSQIIYKDIIPDIESVIVENTNYTGIYSIDFNNDGYEEYNFRWDDWGDKWFVHITFNDLELNKIALDGENSNPYGARVVKPLLKNDPINSSLNWGTSYAEPLIGDLTYNTNFLDKGDRYIGVQFQIESSVYYGWILINFSSESNKEKLIIKSYGYNSSPNQSILAGEGEPFNLGISEKEFEKNTLHPNPFSDKLYLNSYKFDGELTYSLMNNEGKIIQSGFIKDNFINTHDLSQGVYILSISGKNESYISKVIKE
jgi:hypothetical protein